MSLLTHGLTFPNLIRIGKVSGCDSEQDHQLSYSEADPLNYRKWESYSTEAPQGHPAAQALGSVRGRRTPEGGEKVWPLSAARRSSGATGLPTWIAGDRAGKPAVVTARPARCND